MLARPSLVGGSTPRPALGTSDEELEDWTLRMWRRMDRDHSGSITVKEMDCEEFHTAIKLAIAPQSEDGGSTGGAVYGRSELNIKEAIQFCLSKADINRDGDLSFREFRSLVKTMRDPALAQYSANLAFALFDLDTSLSIDKREFRELYRFFLKRNPTEVEFQEEWSRLARSGQDRVTRNEYIFWLQTSPNPAFRQHAPPRVDRSSIVAEMGVRVGQTPKAGQEKGGAPLLPSPKASKAADRVVHRHKPKWNKRFNAGVNPGHINDVRPMGQREYFSRAQSVPELRRFYTTYPGTFRENTETLDRGDTEVQGDGSLLYPKCLSTEGGTPLMLPERHGPLGSMKCHRTGRTEFWDDSWMPPLRQRSRFNVSDRPFAPCALFGEVTDVFANSREGWGEKPAIANRRKPVRTLGGAVLGRASPAQDSMRVAPGRATVLEPEPWSGF